METIMLSTNKVVNVLLEDILDYLCTDNHKSVIKSINDEDEQIYNFYYNSGSVPEKVLMTTELLLKAPDYIPYIDSLSDASELNAYVCGIPISEFAKLRGFEYNDILRQLDFELSETEYDQNIINGIATFLGVKVNGEASIDDLLDYVSMKKQAY